MIILENSKELRCLGNNTSTLNTIECFVKSKS